MINQMTAKQQTNLVEWGNVTAGEQEEIWTDLQKNGKITADFLVKGKPFQTLKDAEKAVVWVQIDVGADSGLVYTLDDFNTGDKYFETRDELKDFFKSNKGIKTEAASAKEFEKVRTTPYGYVYNG